MPLERVSQKFKDISMSFQSNPLTFDLIALKDANAIARSIRNIITTRPGEKLVEYLLNEFEMENVLETKDFFIIPSLNMPVKTYPNSKKLQNSQSYFKGIKTLSKSEITKILKKLYAN